MYYLIALGLSGLGLVVVLTLLTALEDYFDKQPRPKIYPNHIDYRLDKWKKRR